MPTSAEHTISRRTCCALLIPVALATFSACSSESTPSTGAGNASASLSARAASTAQESSGTAARREGNDARHSAGTQERVLEYTYRVTGEHELTFEVQPSDRSCTQLRWVFSEENGVFSIAFVEGVRADGSDVCTLEAWVSTVHFETVAPARSLKVQPLSADRAQLNR